MAEPEITLACPFCGAPTEVEYASTGTSIECIGGEGCHALIVMPCFPHEAERLIRAGGLARGSTACSQSVSSDWLDALRKSVEAADCLFKDLRSDKKYFTAVRAQSLRDDLEKLRRQIESASNDVISGGASSARRGPRRVLCALTSRVSRRIRQEKRERKTLMLRCKYCGEPPEKCSHANADRFVDDREGVAKAHLQERWLVESDELLTAAGVPEWVEVSGDPGNSLPHRLQWYLSRRKDVAEHERAGVLNELNAMEGIQRPNDGDQVLRELGRTSDGSKI